MVGRGGDGAAGQGYESWFLSARSDDALRGLWMRRTVHRGADGRRHHALWCTTFDETVSTVKQVWPEGAGPVFEAGPATFTGTAAMGAHEAAWQVRVEPGADAVRPLRPAWLYRSPVPRTKLEVPVPAGRAWGSVEVDGRRWDLNGWPTTVGHNWGSEHADQWIWLHALDIGPLPWIELVCARIRVGRVLSPWIATGALPLGSRVERLASLTSRPTVALEPHAANVDVTVGRARLHLSVDGALSAAAVLTYRDPRAGTRTVVHHGLASLVLTVAAGSGRTATHAGTCAFEIGAAHSWAAVSPQDLPLEPA